MNKYSITYLILFLGLNYAGFSQSSNIIYNREIDPIDVFTIYPGNGIPDRNSITENKEKTIKVEAGRMTRNVIIPTLSMYKPANGKSNGTSIIVAPGGAFYFLMFDKEGADVAKWLTNYGITTFVLKYRLASTPDKNEEMGPFIKKLFEVLPHPDSSVFDPPIGTIDGEKARLLAEEDGRQSIRFLREHARELEIDPNKIGIMGFSAGGGVAVNSALEHDKLGRPNFAAGIYPGWRKVASIQSDAPPLFIAISDKDALVTALSSAQLYENYHKAGKPIELHIFGNGIHGFGSIKDGSLTDTWTELYIKWLKSLKLIE